MGYDHDSFWDQTPHTLSLTFEAYNVRMANEHNERAWTAWHIAAMQRGKTIPRLRSLLVNQPKTKKQTVEEQLEELKKWVVATGGKVIYKQ